MLLVDICPFSSDYTAGIRCTVIGRRTVPCILCPSGDNQLSETLVGWFKVSRISVKDTPMWPLWYHKFTASNHTFLNTIMYWKITVRIAYNKNPFGLRDVPNMGSLCPLDSTCQQPFFSALHFRTSSNMVDGCSIRSFHAVCLCPTDIRVWLGNRLFRSIVIVLWLTDLFPHSLITFFKLGFCWHMDDRIASVLLVLYLT